MIRGETLCGGCRGEDAHCYCKRCEAPLCEVCWDHGQSFCADCVRVLEGLEEPGDLRG